MVNAGDGGAATAPMANAFAATAARRVTKEAHQILAGVGFTLEHRLPYYYRRVKSVELTLGNVDEQLRQVADRLAL